MILLSTWQILSNPSRQPGYATWQVRTQVATPESVQDESATQKAARPGQTLERGGKLSPVTLRLARSSRAHNAMTKAGCDHLAQPISCRYLMRGCTVNSRFGVNHKTLDFIMI